MFEHRFLEKFYSNLFNWKTLEHFNFLAFLLILSIVASTKQIKKPFAKQQWDLSTFWFIYCHYASYCQSNHSTKLIKRQSAAFSTTMRTWKNGSSMSRKHKHRYNCCSSTVWRVSGMMTSGVSLTTTN